MSSFNRSTASGKNSSLNRRITISSPKVILHRESSEGIQYSWIWQNFCAFVVVGPLITFILVLYCGYLYAFPNIRVAFDGYDAPLGSGSKGKCDICDGSWVRDYSYPLYNSSDCPFVEQGFNCLGNGRRDTDYLKWRWKPKDCDMPRFNISYILEKLRGKRIVFVGDSMSRTQWESLICLLMTGVEDKTSVYEVNGNVITKTIRHLVVRFSTYDFLVEFYRSVFLVRPGQVPKHAPKRVKSTLKLDKLDDISSELVDADVLIFNSGHWWVPSKLFEAGCYFQIGGSLKLGMSIGMAFKTAISTWASWVETSINSSRTRVFFRTFEPPHWSNGYGEHCNVSQFSITEYANHYESPFSTTIINTVKEMTLPVTALRITSMSAFRSDAHVGNWSDRKPVSDCSHWCLPGVPDVWNEILLSYLFPDDEVALL